MKKIVSFLRWDFKGCTRSMSFWGAMVVILAGIMQLADCPSPWPLYTVVAGFAMNFIDMIYHWIRFRVAMYRLDQESVARKLREQ